jgi:hypothetical protein
MDQTQLNTYFGTVWRRKHLDISQFKYTGLALADQVVDSEQVIDIGCGSNPFKGLIKNLVGIDPAFPEADYQMSLEDYSKHSENKFDVAFCLGSINFGDRENIKRQIGLVSDLLKENARVYWRCNPGLQDHANADCKYINFFPWSFVEHEQLSQEFGFSLADLEWDTHDRIYALWIR